MKQAYALSEIENGPIDTWNYGLSSESFYNTYLAKYLKSLNSEVGNSGDSRFVNIYFSDGTKASLGYTHCIVFFPKPIKIKELADIAVCSNNPEELKYVRYGKNAFGFNRKLDTNINPNTSDAQLINSCKNYSFNSCTEIIKRNGWRIPKDYPIRF